MREAIRWIRRQNKSLTLRSIIESTCFLLALEMSNAIAKLPEESMMRADENDSSDSFLETIPNNVLNNVLRFFSILPTTKNWERPVPLVNLVPLFGVFGKLRDVMKTRFTALCVSRTGDRAAKVSGFHWEQPAEGQLSTSDVYAAHSYTLAGGSEALQTLIVGKDMCNDENDILDMVDVLADNCPNVMSLSIEDWNVDRASQWIYRFGNSLTKLEFVGEITHNISMHCTRWAT